MPIKFLCEHCQAKLQIATRKAGTEQTCPRCHQQFLVPAAEVAAAMLAMQASDRYAEAAGPEDEFLDFTLYDEQELIYEPAGTPGGSSLQRPIEVDPDRINLPRLAVYTQGAMLGVVACVFFVFGMLVGQSTSPPSRASLDAPIRCRVLGEVSYLQGASWRPDRGATVLLLPTDRRPDPRPPAAAFHPDSDLDSSSSAWQAIREIGGDATRAAEDGTFELTVSSPRSYVLLVISKQKSRGDETVTKTDRATLGGYFVPLEELVGNRDFDWQEIPLTGSNYRLDEVRFGEP